jgi:putative GTP pyrophosphokinase
VVPQKRDEKLQEIYTVHFTNWDAYLSGLSNKISKALQKNGLKYSIKSRIKTIESLNIKQTQLKNQKKGASKRIGDLFGLRTIVPFQEDVESVINILHNIFTITEIERKAENLSYREFAYDSVHMNISIDEGNLVFPKCCKKGCEIQIRTILQDAWAEVEHTLTYKSNLKFYNESIRKKLAALNANLTL